MIGLRLVVGRGRVIGGLRDIGWNRSRGRMICGLWNISWNRSRSRVICGLWNISWNRSRWGVRCWFMIYWWGVRGWFMIYWWGVRCWRVCWWRDWGVLSLRSDLLTDSLDWEAVEGGEVLLAVSVSSHEGQEGEGGQCSPLHVVNV